MAGWQPGNPGIWIGEGTQRMFAAQASGEWILEDANGVELRRSRTLAGLVAEFDASDERDQDAVPPSAGFWSGFAAGSSRYPTMISRRHSTAVRSCARRSDSGRPTRCCRV